MAYGYVTPTGGFTLEIWFNHTGVPTWAETLFNQQTQNPYSNTSANPAVNGRQFLAYLTAAQEIRVEWRLENQTLIQTWIDDQTEYWNDGQWHFFAVRLSSDKVNYDVWVDGEKKTNTPQLTDPMNWRPGELSIGGSYAPNVGNYGYDLFNGGLAYAAVFDVALTDNRILEHYTAGNSGTVFYGDSEVTRLGRIFDYCSVPTNARRFDSAVTTLQGIQIAGENGLEKTADTAKDAGGLVFADGQSVMVYQNRRHRYNRDPLMTLSESRGSAPNVGMDFTTDDTKVFNDIRVSRPFGGKARIRNRASELEYGRRVYPLELAITSDTEMRNAGTWVAERYGFDRVRISGVTLSAESSADIEELVAIVQIGDRIYFDELPENAPQSFLDFIVEGISVDANFKDQTWTLGLELSPAELWNVMQVGVSTLGDGSRIAY